MDGRLREVVNSVVGRELSASGQNREDGDDASASAIYSLTVALKRWKKEGGAPDSLEAYATTVAKREVAAFLRKTRPQATNLAALIRSTVGATSSLLIEARSKTPFIISTNQSGPALAKFGSTPTDFLNWLTECDRDYRKARAIEMIVWILEWKGGSVGLGDAVELFQAAWSRSDLRRLEDDPQKSEPVVESIVAGMQATDRLIEHRDLLRATWTAIRELPISYTRALLLNLREDEGGVIEYLEIGNFVDREEIAQTLDVDMKWLDSIWEQLPWSNIQIAEWMGVSELDVSNLRMMARRKLKSKLREWFAEAVR